MNNLKIFQKLVVLIFLVFIGILIYVVVFAHTRQSGVTGLNMSDIREMRLNAQSQVLHSEVQ